MKPQVDAVMGIVWNVHLDYSSSRELQVLATGLSLGTCREIRGKGGNPRIEHGL